MVKYLYNGVELPALPEWDREKYPYAYISRYMVFVDWIYNVHFSSSPRYGYSTSGDYCIGRRAGDFSYSATGQLTSWQDKTNWTNEGVIAELDDNLIWANFDILNEDGSVYLAASDPIPVNPAPTLDPTALLMGWQVGNRIRGGA